MRLLYVSGSKESGTIKLMNEVLMVKCGDYGISLRPAIKRVFGELDWLSRENLEGRKVLVKPNMLTDRTPEQAVTTHPEFLRQVLRELKKAGAIITVGDSPASAANIRSVWKKTGMEAVCKEENIELISFEQSGTEIIQKNGYEIAIAKPALETDIILNLPKIKSHSLTVLTAAVKNLYGVIPGYTKTKLHRNHSGINDFGALVKTIHECLPPVWSIADGVIGMEGQGPSNGNPVNLGFIAVSRDPFAMDIAICRTLGIDALQVPYLAADNGIKKHAPDISGDEISVKSFKIPAGAHLMNRVPCWLLRMAMRVIWVRPAFSEEKCIRCGLCVKACPVNALKLDKSQQAPLLDTKTCITCSCCHEVCPEDAIHMRQSPLLKMVGAFKDLK